MGAEIAGSNNTATDSSAAGSPSAEVFPTNSQALTLFPFPPLNIRPWNVESLESTNNSPLALVQGVARATVQMNRGMGEREQRDLEREQLQRDQDRRETEIRMRRKREMIERERREIRRSRGRREWQEAVPGPWCSCRLDEFVGDTICGRCDRQRYLERNSVFTNAVENFDQRSGQSGGSVTNRSHSSFVLDELGQRVDGACTLLERVSRERQSEEFDREIERQEHEIRTGAVLSERTRKKRGGEARQLPEVSMWPQRPFPALLCNLSEQCEENLKGEGSGRQRILKDNPLHHDISKCNVCLKKWLQRKPKCIPQSGQDECCICLEVMAEIKGPDFSNCCKARLIDAFESHFIGVMEAGWLINE
ncbi:uncharacterized protein [Pocillopora verrucosa]|uniref:uncharacterized protein n=1 Tax=Pocillopora verrucosa TaxID=203993 RepID=UPI003341A99E